MVSALRTNYNITEDSDIIKNYIVDFHKNLFGADRSVRSELSVLSRVILSLVFIEENCTLTTMPLKIEIKDILFSMNQNNASDPDGFGGIFYTFY